MKRYTITLLIALISFQSSFAKDTCENNVQGKRKIEIDWETFTTKKDSGSNVGFFPKLLFCDNPRNSNKCNDSSIWFEQADFAKYKASYMPVVCSYVEHHIVNGSNSSKLVIYIDDNM